MDSAPRREHIFISYRRNDTRGASGRLYDWLRIAFGRERVFRDVHSIGVGKWRDKIDSALAQSAACIAVVGQGWANAENLARLHDPSDMVLHELTTALGDAEMTLVPTLVEGARIPTIESLPTALQPLFIEWNCREVTENGWEDDIRRLIDEITAATQIPVGPNLEALLHNAELAEARIRALEQERQLQVGQIDALRHTLDELRGKLAAASHEERPELAAAFAALARGDSLVAEQAFEREFRQRVQAQQQEAKAAAEAARNVANLALLRDIGKALDFYRQAARLQPEDPEAWRLLGETLIQFGDLTGAAAALERSLQAAKAQPNDWAIMAAHGGIGDIAVGRGNLAEALAAFSHAQTIAQSRLQTAKDDLNRQRDLSVSYDRVGNVLVAQGQLGEALQAYRDSLAIRERLAEADPQNAGWQRDLSVSYNKVGEVLVAQGQLGVALQAYRDSLAIREPLAEADPHNAGWQRDLSVSYDNIGDVLVAQGQLGEALQAYRGSLAIRERLAEADPQNAGWQRDVAVSCGKLATTYRAAGDTREAKEYLLTGQSIMARLVEQYPGWAQWESDLKWFNEQIARL